MTAPVHDPPNDSISPTQRAGYSPNGTLRGANAPPSPGDPSAPAAKDAAPNIPSDPAPQSGGRKVGPRYTGRGTGTTP
jgi:hypothetical protein